MDTHQIRLTGTAEIDSTLDDSKYILIAGEFDITDTSKKPTEEGYQYTYKLYPLRLAQVSESGEKIRLKTKNSNSKRIKGAIWNEQKKRQEFADMDEETYYNLFADRLIAELSSVLDYLKL